MTHTDFLTGARLLPGEDVVALLLLPSRFVSEDSPISCAHLMRVVSLPLAGRYDSERILVSMSDEAKLALTLSFAGIPEMTSLERVLNPFDHLHEDSVPADYRAPHVCLLKKTSYELLMKVGALDVRGGRESVDTALQFYEDAVNQVKARRDGDPAKEHFAACLRLEGSTCYFPTRSDPASAIETPVPFWFFNDWVSMQSFAYWDYEASAGMMHQSEENRRVLFQGLLDLLYLNYGMLALCRQYTPSMRVNDEPNDQAIKALASLMLEQTR